MPLSKPALARLLRLHDKKHREAAGLFVVEGGKVIGELLAAGLPLLEIYATAEWLKETGASLPRTAPEVVTVTPGEMRRASHYPTPAGVLAVGRIVRQALGPGELDHGLTLALDGVQDPGNVGTLLRIADWFAFDRVLLSPDCADLFSQKVINASMGSFARVRVCMAPLAAALAGTRAPVFGCELAGEDVQALPPPRDAIVVIGSEGRGLSPEVAARVTRQITIPRHGRAESLNAAVAGGIICAQFRRSGQTPA